jgi:hypothetical protein
MRQHAFIRFACCIVWRGMSTCRHADMPLHSWWSKHVGVILSVLLCDIWINVLLQTSALVGPLYIVNFIYSELKCTVRQFRCLTKHPSGKHVVVLLGYSRILQPSREGRMRKNSAKPCLIGHSLLGSDSPADMLLGNAVRPCMCGDCYFLCCQFRGGNHHFICRPLQQFVPYRLFNIMAGPGGRAV